MNVFHKLFGYLFGQAQKEPTRTPGANAGEWDAVLSKCDLLKARDWIVDMHRFSNEEAEKQGG
jgi:hypothetical protein